jgi:hypothetical protein
MSDRKTPDRFAKALFRGAGAAIDPTVNKNGERIRGRHAAITNNVNNWRSYKEWTDKVRGTWIDKK